MKLTFFTALTLAIAAGALVVTILTGVYIFTLGAPDTKNINSAAPLPGESFYEGQIEGFTVQILEESTDASANSIVTLGRLDSSEKIQGLFYYHGQRWELGAILFYNRVCELDGTAGFERETSKLEDVQTYNCPSDHLNRAYALRAQANLARALTEVHTPEHLTTR